MATVTRQPLMTTKLRGLRKGPRTFLTHKRLLPGVCPYMVIQCGRARERTTAKTALERSLAIVRYHVCTQVRGVGKGLGTMAALVRFFRQAWTDVDLQQGTLGKALETLATSPDTSFQAPRALAALRASAPTICIHCVSGFLFINSSSFCGNGVAFSARRFDTYFLVVECGA